MKTKDELVEWLRDAYAMEKAMEISLKKQMETQGVSVLLREQLAFHLTETQHHAEAVAACLKKLGSEVSTLKTAMAKGLEIMKGASTAFAGDHRVKDLLGMCAAEHFEIACYTALRAGAQRFGHTDIVDTCNEILRDEQRMADWLEGNLPQVVMSYLDEEGGTASSADAEDDDMPDMEPASRRQEATGARPGLQSMDIHEGREVILGGEASHAEAVGEMASIHVDDKQAEFVLPPSMQGSSLSATGSTVAAPAKGRGRPVPQEH